MKNYFEIIKTLRAARGIKQKEVAELLDMTVNAYQKYEYGEREPNMATFVLLADYLNAPLDYLTCRVKYLNKGVCTMELTDIIEVFETTSTAQANSYLRIGWQLLDITKGIGSADMQMNPFILYCLGWNVAKGEVVHPEQVKTGADVDLEDMPF